MGTCLNKPFTMGNAGLSKEEVQTLEDKTHYTQAEIKELHKAFKERDADNSGNLDKDEFIGLMREQMGDGTSDAQLEAMFVSFDHDGSGDVSFNELTVALSMLSTMDVESKLDFCFSLYDADNSGHLCTDELRAVIEQMLLVSSTLGREEAAAESFVDGIIMKLDMDNDGSITKEEWIAKGLSTPSLLVLLNQGGY